MDRERREPEAIRRKKRRRRSPEEIEEIRRRRRAVEREKINDSNKEGRIPRRSESERPVNIEDPRRVKEQLKAREGTREKAKISILKKIIIGIAAVLFLCIISGIILMISFISKIDNEGMIASTKPSKGEPVNILLLGMDIGDTEQVENMSVKRTDTMMLINYNPNTKSTQVVSIPRDTLVRENGQNYKINAAFGRGGSSKVKQVVENMLDIKINYMMNIDYAAFRGFIDAIGGVEMEIERDMLYDDEGQSLHINFKGGTVEQLDGKKAEEFFRWRKNNDGTGLATGDLGRIENQQKFLSKVTKKCTSPLIIFKVPKILDVVASNIKSNMSGTENIRYGLKIMSSKGNGFKMSTIQGDAKMIGGQSYVVFDKTLNSELITSLKSKAGNSNNKVNKESTKIIVLNGTNISGLASQVKTDLAAAGFSKVDTGNTNSINKSIVKTDNATLKEYIIELLPNIKKSDNKSDESKYSDYDVVIILGADYRN